MRKRRGKNYLVPVFGIEVGVVQVYYTILYEEALAKPSSNL